MGIINAKAPAPVQNKKIEARTYRRPADQIAVASFYKLAGESTRDPTRKEYFFAKAIVWLEAACAQEPGWAYMRLAEIAMHQRRLDIARGCFHKVKDSKDSNTKPYSHADEETKLSMFEYTDVRSGEGGSVHLHHTFLEIGTIGLVKILALRDPASLTALDINDIIWGLDQFPVDLRPYSAMLTDAFLKLAAISDPPPFPAVQAVVGKMYLEGKRLDGTAIPQNEEQALAFLTAAAQEGNIMALNELGGVCYKREEKEKGFQYYLQAAQLAMQPKAVDPANDGFALMIRVGSLYQLGRGVARNDAQAVFWYLEASKISQRNILIVGREQTLTATSHVSGRKLQGTPQDIAYLYLAEAYRDGGEELAQNLSVAIDYYQHVINSVEVKARLYEKDPKKDARYKEDKRTYDDCKNELDKIKMGLYSSSQNPVGSGVGLPKTPKAPEPFTDVFLTHTWQADELGRNTHERVAVVNKKLKEKGYVTWFDTDRMQGNIVDKMTSGIDRTKIVIVFVTKKYMDKVGGDRDDNCKSEFNYAFQRKGTENMLAVVMEPFMKDSKKWMGPLGMHLGGHLYVNMAETDAEQDVEELVAALVAKGLVPGKAESGAE